MNLQPGDRAINESLVPAFWYMTSQGAVYPDGYLWDTELARLDTNARGEARMTDATAEMLVVNTLLGRLIIEHVRPVEVEKVAIIRPIIAM